MKNNRIFEIDLFRVIAICLMIIFHFVYDLNEFAKVDIDYNGTLWHYIGEISALIFIFVSGVSSGLSRNCVKRGTKVFGFGMLLTIVTYFFDRTEYIRFGILHFLGIAMILSPLLNRLKKWQMISIGIISLLFGSFAANTIVSTFLLLPFGLVYNNFSSMDYYPLFPYLSVYILGILIFRIFYYKGDSIFKTNYNSKVIQYISKNSLIIYLIHQPILLSMIYIFKFANL